MAEEDDDWIYQGNPRMPVMRKPKPVRVSVGTTSASWSDRMNSSMDSIRDAAGIPSKIGFDKTASDHIGNTDEARKLARDLTKGTGNFGARIILVRMRLVRGRIKAQRFELEIPLPELEFVADSDASPEDEHVPRPLLKVANVARRGVIGKASTRFSLTLHSSMIQPIAHEVDGKITNRLPDVSQANFDHAHVDLDVVVDGSSMPFTLCGRTASYQTKVEATATGEWLSTAGDVTLHIEFEPGEAFRDVVGPLLEQFSKEPGFRHVPDIQATDLDRRLFDRCLVLKREVLSKWNAQAKAVQEELEIIDGDAESITVKHSSGEVKVIAINAASEHGIGAAWLLADVAADVGEFEDEGEDDG